MLTALRAARVFTEESERIGNWLRLLQIESWAYQDHVVSQIDSLHLDQIQLLFLQWSLHVVNMNSVLCIVVVRYQWSSSHKINFSTWKTIFTLGFKSVTFSSTFFSHESEEASEKNKSRKDKSLRRKLAAKIASYLSSFFVSHFLYQSSFSLILESKLDQELHLVLYNISTICPPTNSLNVSIYCNLRTTIGIRFNTCRNFIFLVQIGWWLRNKWEHQHEKHWNR